MAIDLKNRTDFPIMRFSNLDNQGREFGVIMLKAAFDIQDNGDCVVSPEQEPFNFTDLCYGNVNESSLQFPSDMVSYKPVTDIIINAVAKSPDNLPSEYWQSSFSVSDNEGLYLEKTLNIFGPRYWQPQWKKQLTENEKKNWHEHFNLFSEWKLSSSEPIRYLPIRYEYAFGGTLKKQDNSQHEILEAYEYNPIGCGWIDKKWTDHTKRIIAPQIEDPNNPITTPYKQYRPAGFGAIPPAWLPRRPLGGTYDQNWIDNVWPNWPADYNFRFNNSSPFESECKRFISENIIVNFKNVLLPCNANILKIIKPLLFANIKINNNSEKKIFINIDTIIINLIEKNRNDCRIYAIWRLPYDLINTDEISIFATPEWMDPLDMKSALDQPPLPSVVAVDMKED